MARVAIYQPGQVQRTGTTGEKLRPADFSANVGAGLEAVGGALQQRAEVHTRLAELSAEDEARRLDVEHMGQVREIRERVRSARGMGAVQAYHDAADGLRDVNSELMGRATSPLVRRLLQNSIATRSEQEIGAWGDYATGQEREAGDNAVVARATGFRENALDHPAGSVEAESNLGAGEQEIRNLSTRQGWGPDITRQKIHDYRSSYHSSRVSQLFQGDDASGAQAYLDAHVGEMSAQDEESSRSLIRGELLANQQAADSAFIVQGGGPAAPHAEGEPPPPPGEARWQPPVRAHTVTVPGGQYGAPRGYGGHVGHDYAAPAGTPVYPMAEGVAHVSRSRGGGNTVTIDYGPGYQSRYLHLQDGSIPVRDGQRVGPDDVVGRIGDTGAASHGNHLHAELVTPHGRVDPSAMVSRDAPSLPPANGTRVDLAEMYRRIDAQPWSESRRRRAREGVEQWAGQNDQIRARTENDAERVITEALVAINRDGSRLTSLSQLPAEALRRANPSVVLQLEEQIRTNGRAQPPANSPLMNSLIVQAGTDPSGFLREVNPELLRGRITGEEVQQLTQMRLTIGNRAGPQPGQILGVINFVLPQTGLVPGTNDPLPSGYRARGETTAQARTRYQNETQNDVRARLMQATQRRLAVQFPHGTIVTQQDILNAVRAEVTQVSVDGQTMPAFQARERGATHFGVPVPNAALPLIGRVLSMQGLPITQNNIAQEYNRHRTEYDAAAH